MASWEERWELLSIAAAAIAGAIARRHLSGRGAPQRLARLLNARVQLEICEAERAYLRQALEEILAAASARRSEPSGPPD